MRDYMFLEEAIFTLDEAREEFNSEGALFGALKRAIDRREIKKLTGGLYCALNLYTGEPEVDRFEIATALRPEGCCAYRSALEYYGLLDQRYDEVQLVSSRQEEPVLIDGTEYRTYRSRLKDGVMEATGSADAPVRVTDVERTMLDCLDRLDLGGGLQDVFNALCKVRNASEEKLLKHLEAYGHKFLYKKAGCLLSIINPPYISGEFLDICLEMSSKRADDIRPTKGIPSIFSKEWNLYVPSYIAKKSPYIRPRARSEEPAPETVDVPAACEPVSYPPEGNEPVQGMPADAEGAAAESAAESADSAAVPEEKTESVPDTEEDTG
ncbi:MAG: hypothetical protein LUD51_06040 [Clostridia bacterium]|nr:hypothetical protein [Clostridia bacterium]